MTDLRLEDAPAAFMRFAESVPRVGVRAQRELTAAVAAEEVRLMPVDTGRAEASVRASAGDATVADLAPVGPYTPLDQSAFMTATAGMTAGDTTFITDDAKNPRNGFVYAWPIAVTGNQKNPEGVVAPALEAGGAQWPAIVERAIQEEGDR